MPRLCPHDKTPLTERRIERVNVDVCSTCSGSFFDAIELWPMTGRKEFALTLSKAHGQARSPIACPACDSAMHLDSVEGIEVDHCGECLGVWLDAGESERLRARETTPGERLRAVALHLPSVGDLP